jgi:hypothetical protein
MLACHGWLQVLSLHGVSYSMLERNLGLEIVAIHPKSEASTVAFPLIREPGNGHGTGFMG